MKSFGEFETMITEAQAGGHKGINKDEWTYGGNGFDSKTAPIERYLATKGSDFKAFAWEGLRWKQLDIEVDGLKFNDIEDIVASNLDSDFLSADKEMRRYTKVFSKTKGPTFVPKKGKWAIDSKLAKIINFAGREFAKNKNKWKTMGAVEIRKDFTSIMQSAGFNVNFNHTKEQFNDADMQYANEVIGRAMLRLKGGTNVR